MFLENGFYFLTAVLPKIHVLWNATPCRLGTQLPMFRALYYVHLQGEKSIFGNFGKYLPDICVNHRSKFHVLSMIIFLSNRLLNIYIFI